MGYVKLLENTLLMQIYGSFGFQIVYIQSRLHISANLVWNNMTDLNLTLYDKILDRSKSKAFADRELILVVQNYCN